MPRAPACYDIQLCHTATNEPPSPASRIMVCSVRDTKGKKYHSALAFCNSAYHFPKVTAAHDGSQNMFKQAAGQLCLQTSASQSA